MAIFKPSDYRLGIACVCIRYCWELHWEHKLSKLGWQGGGGPSRSVEDSAGPVGWQDWGELAGLQGKEGCLSEGKRVRGLKIAQLRPRAALQMYKTFVRSG